MGPFMQLVQGPPVNLPYAHPKNVINFMDMKNGGHS